MRPYLIAIFSTLCLAIVFFFSNRKNIGDEITIRTNYTMYACGECYPQHRIKEIINPKQGFEFLLDKEINIIYSSRKQEDSIKKATEKCIICYQFFFTGKVIFSEKNGYVFKAKSAKIKLWDDKCCD